MGAGSVALQIPNIAVEVGQPRARLVDGSRVFAVQAEREHAEVIPQVVGVARADRR